MITTPIFKKCEEFRDITSCCCCLRREKNIRCLTRFLFHGAVTPQAEPSTLRHITTTVLSEYKSPAWRVFVPTCLPVNIVFGFDSGESLAAAPCLLSGRGVTHPPTRIRDLRSESAYNRPRWGRAAAGQLVKVWLRVGVWRLLLRTAGKHVIWWEARPVPRCLIHLYVFCGPLLPRFSLNSLSSVIYH